MKNPKAVTWKFSAFSLVSHKLNTSQKFRLCQPLDNQEHTWIQTFGSLIFLSSDSPLTTLSQNQQTTLHKHTNAWVCPF